MEFIEWIYDLYGRDVNPLATDDGVNQMKTLAGRNKVSVRSVCADYFMDKPLVRADVSEYRERMETLLWLLGRCRAVGITRMVLPFVDASSIETADDADRVVESLERALPVAEQEGIEMHLETSLPPERFAALLERVPHPLVKVNYDSGNSASLGFDTREELAAYGQRVGSVHIKDRIRGGGTVPLGQGDADFDALFACLKRVGYAGDYVLQVARDTPGDEIAWARSNRAYFEQRRRTAMEAY